MGIIYDGNVEEKKLYKAYGLTVYGKINRYIWTIYNNKEDECIITLRIAGSDGNNILDMYLGNVCIMCDNFDRTIDNFLYWISTEKPDAEQIEKQVYESLCKSNCLFNHQLELRKCEARREETQRKMMEERRKKEQAALDKIKNYCRENNFIFYYDGVKVFILNPLNEKAKETIECAIESGKMKMYIQFAEEYPDNKDLHIIQSGEIQEIHAEH